MAKNSALLLTWVTARRLNEEYFVAKVVNENVLSQNWNVDYVTKTTSMNCAALL